jgi:DNA topoisomerase-1
VTELASEPLNCGTGAKETIAYVFDDEPGLQRRRNGKGFSYSDQNGRPVSAKAQRRIKRLTIPPAWTEVWICPDPGGHIQATGRDAKGRKQYIYHSEFRIWREHHKFQRILDFAAALPKLRECVARDLNNRKLTQTLVLATAVHVLERTLMRVGNDEYAKQNQSYGLTTLLNDHIETKGRRVRFSFRGKSGKTFDAEFSDRRVAAVLRRLEGVPGQHLFQFVDEAGEAHRITSDDVNAYIRDATNGDFTAKDFRTWTATVLAVVSLIELEPSSNPTGKKRNIAQAMKVVARRLGNTPVVCRTSYVHPEVLQSYSDGSLPDFAGRIEETLDEENRLELSSAEKQVLRFLKRRMAEMQKGGAETEAVS